MKLIDGWKNGWRLTSVQAAFLLTVLSVLAALHDQVLPLFQFAIPDKYWPWVTAIWGALIVVLRLIAQPGVLTDGEASTQPPKDGSDQHGFVLEGLLLPLGIGMSALVIGFLIGSHHANTRCNQARATANAKAAQVAASATMATAAVAASAADKQIEVKTVFKDRIIKQYVEVPREVIRKEDAGCIIPGRFVSVWNTANRAELPTFAGQLDAAPSRVALSEVAAQHDREAELCIRNTETLKSIQAAERKRQQVMEAGK